MNRQRLRCVRQTLVWRFSAGCLMAAQALACSDGATSRPKTGAAGGEPQGMPSSPPVVPSPTASVIPPDPNNIANPPANAPADALAPTTRAARLTHLQWENSVRDLFHLDASTSYARNFRSDPASNGFLFDNNALSLEVDSTLWQGYQRAAEQVAALVTSDVARLAALLPPPNSDVQARARQFILDLGARAYRRKLSDTESNRYWQLFNSAKGLYGDMPDFDAGVRLTIETFLSSPHFLYRVELSSAKQGNVIPLNPSEIATRLSYTLWNTLPDSTLLSQALSGSLSTNQAVSTEAQRLLADARARPVLVHFNTQLFAVSRYSMISPSPVAYPGVGMGLGASAEQELRLFSGHTLFDQNAGFAKLLTSNDSFVNSQLAGIYGLSGTFTAEFSPVTLASDKRHGILTQVGFLASNANSVDPDPIHRGVFLANRLLCLTIAAPGGTIPPLPPPGMRTNRQRVKEHTEQPGTPCAACHGSVINPLGFPFENYDSVGAYRTIDNGLPVDSASSAQLGATSVAVKDAVELAEALSKSDQAHECYSRHLLEYAFGRPGHANDLGIIQRLGKASLQNNLGVKALLANLASGSAFLNRSTEELQ